MRAYILVALWLVLSTTAWANPMDVYEAEVFKHEGRDIRYRIMYPENFDENAQYPLVLFLHGAGERGNDNISQLTHGAALFADDNARKVFNPIVIFPQAPKADYWASVDVDRSQVPFRFDYHLQASPTKALAGVMALVDAIAKQSYVDKRRIYVGGLSMGGMGTFEILARKPNLFAAAFVICGGADTDVVNRYREDLPLWVFHGGKDDVVAPHYAKRVVDALSERDQPVKWTLYPDDNHNSWDSAFAEPNLLPWLFSQRLKSASVVAGDPQFAESE